MRIKNRLVKRSEKDINELKENEELIKNIVGKNNLEKVMNLTRKAKRNFSKYPKSGKRSVKTNKNIKVNK